MKEQLLEFLQKYPYVSFDLFDTLVFRSFEKPMDVFDAVEYIYNNNNEHDNVLKGFCKQRHLAEIQARDAANGSEITIDTIYALLPYSKDERETLEMLEKRVEIENIIPNRVMIDILLQLQKIGKHILITTDMYLDRNTIDEILHRIHVENYELFLSSETIVTKASGKMFPKILKKLHISNLDIVHIGDNAISDIQSANEAGIRAYLRIAPIQQVSFYFPYMKGIVAKHLHSYIINTTFENLNELGPAYRIGFNVLGPIVESFCKWVKYQAKVRNAQRIVFVAREGHLLKNVYDSLFPDDFDKTEYVYLNKNILRFPCLFLNPTEEQFLNTIPNRKSYSVKELLGYLFIEQPAIFLTDLPCRIDLSESKVLLRKDILKGKYHLFFSTVFEKLNHRFQEQYNYLIRYLRSKNIIGSDFLLVNNSINGNGQIMLEMVMQKANIPGKIYGLQFTRSRQCKRRLKDRSVGWITDGNLPLRYTMTFDRCALLLEHLMFEPTGTALYFKRTSEDIIPVFERQVKEENNYTTIAEIQRYALLFVKDYQKKLPMYYGPKSIEFLYLLVDSPLYEDVVLLSTLYDDEPNGGKSLPEAMDWQIALMMLNNEKDMKIKIKFYFSFLHDRYKALGSKIKSMLNLK